MLDIFTEFIKDKNHICIIQAENPDGDSLGSALALEGLLKDHHITLYCPVSIPKYLHYYTGWSRVSSDFDFKADGYIIVDTVANVLISKLLDDPVIKNILNSKPVLALDHHETPDDFEFKHQSIIQTLPSCCSLILKIVHQSNLKITQEVAENLFSGLLSDTLGLTTASVTAETFIDASTLTSLGANISELEERRREFMKKSQRILNYKADLIKRVEYHLDGKIATVHIPWEDIKEYSDEYNPNTLILEELRMVEGVELAVTIKTYPDGKLTGKIRSNRPISEKVANYFGGGGHPYASGFRTYDIDYRNCVKDIIQCFLSLKDEGK